MAGLQPNNVTLDFTISHGNGIVDIPRALSLLNRRSYRSGYVYSVDFVEYIGAQNDMVRIGCLPCSYPLFQAYKLGFETWKNQRADAIAETNIEPGKWSDFKPFYSQGHVIGAGGGGFTEYTVQGISDYSLNLADLDDTRAEWNRAEIMRNDPVAATVTTIVVGMLGDDDIANQYGSLMDAYGDTRAATMAPDPLLPNVAPASWIIAAGAASSAMTSTVVDYIEDENDRPPYANQEDETLPPTYVGNGQSAPGGLLLDMSRVGSTGRPVTLDGGLLPLGFLIFNATMVNTEAVANLRVHCTRGEYKGVAALSMGEFN